MFANIFWLFFKIRNLKRCIRNSSPNTEFFYILVLENKEWENDKFSKNY